MTNIHNLRLVWKNPSTGNHIVNGYVGPEDAAYFFTVQYQKSSASSPAILIEFELFDKVFKKDIATGIIDETDIPTTNKKLLTVVRNAEEKRYDMTGEAHYMDQFNIVKNLLKLNS